MATYKTKAIIAGSIAIILIAIITTISLWPTNFTDEMPSSDKLPVNDMTADQSKPNLVNLHMKMTNYTIITTTNMVVCGIIIIIAFLIKEYVASRRLKKQKQRPTKDDKGLPHVLPEHQHLGQQHQGVHHERPPAAARLAA